MTENIEVFINNSIRIIDRIGTIYIDPYEMKEEPHDADYIFITHDHYDHYSPEDILKIPDDELKIKSANEIKFVVLDIKNMIDTLSRSDMRMNFNDLRDALKNKGQSYIGIGEGEGKEKVSKAIDQAINNPLMTIEIKGAKSIVISVIGNIGLKDTEIIEDYFLDMFGEDIDILFCITKEKTLGDRIRLTILAAGIKGEV